MTNVKKKGLIVLTAVALWYAFLTALPKISNGIPSEHYMLLHTLEQVTKQKFDSCEALKAYLASKDCPGVTAVDREKDIFRMDFDMLPDYKLILACTGDKWTYYGLMTTASNDNWTLTAIPEKPEVYTEGIFNRIVFLDFDKYHCHRYLVRSKISKVFYQLENKPPHKITAQIPSKDHGKKDETHKNAR